MRHCAVALPQCFSVPMQPKDGIKLVAARLRRHQLVLGYTLASRPRSAVQVLLMPPYRSTGAS
jgi:hypothetical protein